MSVIEQRTDAADAPPEGGGGLFSGRFLPGPTGLGAAAARLLRPYGDPGGVSDSDSARASTPDGATDGASESAPGGGRVGGGRDRGDGLVIPRFSFPWPSACHPRAQRAEEGALAFAERFGLVPTAAYRARLERTRYGWLAARCYPDSDEVLLQICADYFIWFFIVDDLFVDRVETLSERTIPNLTAMIDVLDHHRPGAEPVFGELAWLDVCTRLRAYLSAEHFQRFAHGMRMWASTAGLQIANHLQADTVDVPQYETIRRHTSGTYPCLALSDAAKAGPVTPAEYNSPPVQRLALHANNVVCWSNDVQSLKMELNQPGQYWNMAAIYAHRGLGMQEAVDLVATRVHGEIASFQSLALTLEPHVPPRLRGFVDGLRHWMRGYQDWVESDTQRYADAFIAEDADDTAVPA